MVSKFGSLIVKDIGGISPFVMAVVFAITNLVFVAVGMFTSDRVGRRHVPGTAFCFPNVH